MTLAPEIKQGFKRIAVPVALNNLLMSSVSFIDTLMIGQLGATAISAVGIGNQVFFSIYTYDVRNMLCCKCLYCAVQGKKRS